MKVSQQRYHLNFNDMIVNYVNECGLKLLRNESPAVAANAPLFCLPRAQTLYIILCYAEHQQLLYVELE